MSVRESRVEYQPFPKLTKTFVVEKVRVGWKDLAWAAANHWLDTKSLVELTDGLAEGDEQLRVAIAIAALDQNETVLHAIIDRQAVSDETPDATVRERWMRLAVAWLYEHRESVDDPWAVLEGIWEAFGHAESLNGLIRWMPTPLGGEPGEEGMVERWRTYAEAD
ncbi:MAG: DUF2247 family protein [Isosphaeraceae bacterium]|jgi:hypothetical protein